MMPVMNGIERRVIKSDEDISHTPLLVLTANSTVKTQIDSLTIGGAEGYLDKPFDMAVLRVCRGDLAKPFDLRVVFSVNRSSLPIRSLRLRQCEVPLAGYSHH